MNNAHNETRRNQNSASSNQDQPHFAMPTPERSVDAAARRATTAAPVNEKDSLEEAKTTFSLNNDVPEEIAPKPRLSRRQKIGIAAVAALSAVVLGVSTAALFLPQQPAVVGGAQSSSEVFGAELSSSSAPSATSSSSAGEKPSAAPGSGEASVMSGEEAASSASAPSPEASASDGGAASSGGSSAPSAPPVVETPSVQAPAPTSTITVKVSVDSSAVGNPVSGGASATFSSGASVYDALMACGLSVNANTSPFGVYVSAIGGLAEHEHGGMSGWKYSINGGSPPGLAASAYILSDGDVVSWFYSL